jgi:tetratricopeptide (TPR) repeat protein
MSYVALPPARQKPGRIAVAGMIVGSSFALLFVGVLLGFDRKAAPLTVSVSPVAAVSAPYDIMINASDVTPPSDDGGTAAENVLPTQVWAARPLPHQAVVTVAANDAPDEAGVKAEKAQKLAHEGDVRAALAFQHRAADLSPKNMLYRLQLAILFDRVGDRKSAATLYRQVVDAYAAKDPTLPRALGMDGIRRRADYLMASTGQP